MITAIFPREPNLSLYETATRNVAGSSKKCSHSDSLNRLPFRLNWLVLFTNSNALTSPLCFAHSKIMEASAALKNSSAEFARESAASRQASALRMLSRRSESSSVKYCFPKFSQAFQEIPNSLIVISRENDALNFRMGGLYFGDFHRTVVNEYD